MRKTDTKNNEAHDKSFFAPRSGLAELLIVTFTTPILAEYAHKIEFFNNLSNATQLLVIGLCNIV